MGYIGSFLKSPKKEEQEVPYTKQAYANEETDVMYELEGIWGLEDEDKLSGENMHQLSWDLMEWEEFPNCTDQELEEEEDQKIEHTSEILFEEASQSHDYNNKVIKEENNTSTGFWDDDERKVSLNLNLNYQEVLDAWSDRGPALWANDYSVSLPSNGYYMGEVPVMEEERTRREASVLRYKEKRQTRLFSKKIRYQVRKLNADKRPRLKGRFVKRVS